MESMIVVIIGLGYVLNLISTKSLHKPVVTYCQFEPGFCDIFI